MTHQGRIDPLVAQRQILEIELSESWKDGRDGRAGTTRSRRLGVEGRYYLDWRSAKRWRAIQRARRDRLAEKVAARALASSRQAANLEPLRMRPAAMLILGDPTYAWLTCWLGPALALAVLAVVLTTSSRSSSGSLAAHCEAVSKTFSRWLRSCFATCMASLHEPFAERNRAPAFSH